MQVDSVDKKPTRCLEGVEPMGSPSRQEGWDLLSIRGLARSSPSNLWAIESW